MKPWTRPIPVVLSTLILVFDPGSATLAQFRRFSFGVSAVIALVGALVVLVTLMGGVRERTGNFSVSSSRVFTCSPASTSWRT